MGIIRKTNNKGQYPRTVNIDLPQRTSTKRNVVGTLGNNAGSSSVTGTVKGYAIELGNWVRNALEQFWISPKYMAFTPQTAAELAIQLAKTPAFEGLMVFSSDTDGTFTSIGLWIYEDAGWAKL